MKNKILIVLSLLLSLSIAFGCIASADMEYRPAFAYDTEYSHLITTDGDDRASETISFSMKYSPDQGWAAIYTKAKDMWQSMILPSYDDFLIFSAGARITFKYRVYSSVAFAGLNPATAEFDFVARNGSNGSLFHTRQALNFSEVSSADPNWRDYEITIENNSMLDLRLNHVKIHCTSTAGYSGTIGVYNLRYHVWTETEKANASQVDAINKQTETITEGWTQSEVDPPPGADKMEDYSQQESELLDGQQSGLESGKQSFSQTLTDIYFYQGAFLGIASFFMSLVNASPALTFIVYTSLSLGLCSFILSLGMMIVRSARDRVPSGRHGKGG